jgi:hypothetical protein
LKLLTCLYFKMMHFPLFCKAKDCCRAHKSS